MFFALSTFFLTLTNLLLLLTVQPVPLTKMSIVKRTYWVLVQHYPLNASIFVSFDPYCLACRQFTFRKVLAVLERRFRVLYCILLVFVKSDLVSVFVIFVRFILRILTTFIS